MGNNALKELDQGFGNTSDRGLVVAGRVLGIIGTVLFILSCIFTVFAFLFMGSIAATQP